jgi:hypothetical protein
LAIAAKEADKYENSPRMPVRAGDERGGGGKRHNFFLKESGAGKRERECKYARKGRDNDEEREKE